MHITGTHAEFCLFNAFCPTEEWKETWLGMNVHFDAVGMSLVRSPYVGMYRFNETPRASFRSRMSHLLRKRISWTYMTRAHQFRSANAVRKQKAAEGDEGNYLAKEF